MNLFSSQLYKIMEWITRFAYLQLLWILFTLAGVTIAGIFPATAALFSIMRDWLKGKREVRLFSAFSTYFKAEFWKSNLLGLVLLFITALMGIDLYFIQEYLGQSFSWLYIPWFALLITFSLFLSYVFPVFVYYDVRIGRVLKHSLLIMLISPIQSVTMMLSISMLCVLMWLVPALGFIFGAPAAAFIMMWAGLHAFYRVDQKAG
ncbi:YesL family protein [Halobacillus sp. Marseille-P3879]|uniref:YesL family protein n=1 Tax=Halobacillus TaxID=45667 RepID=UPI000C7A81BC|nr:DUF624 domain-containing protein [Halobacillus sp. Marseille-P3879]